MPSLRAFLKRLDAAGELARVTAPVSPILEVSEIADRQSKLACPAVSEHARAFDPGHCELGGRALLFESVEGSDFPLAINIFGSYRRMEMAMRCEDGGFEAIAARIGAMVKPEPPRSAWELLAKGRQFAPLLRIPPRTVNKGACQEVVRLADRGEVDLTRLPIIKCWPLDGDPHAVGYSMDADGAGTAAGGGRYITFAGMHTISAEDATADRPGSHNIGMYRAQLIDGQHLAMHWHMHHDGAAHWRSWKRAGRPMPIAICLGGEPVLPYAATCPLPPGLSELLMAGYLNGRGIPLVRARTVPLRVPANCEIVIEGWVDTSCGSIGWDPADGEPLGDGAVFEGPFGDHTGFYSLPDRYPIVNVTAVTHRRDAVYPTTIVGLPPQEDYYLGKATERIFLPLLQTLIPDIDDYHLPMFGCFHNCAFVRIAKAYPLQGRRVMHAIWGAGQMAWTKLLVLLDEDVDVHDEIAVMRAVFEHAHFGRDLELVNGPLDILDHASPRLGAGHKLGIDATRKIPGEEVGGYPADPHDYPVPRPDVVATLTERLAGSENIVEVALPAFGHGRLVIVSVDKTAAGDGARAIERVWTCAEGIPADFVVAVDGCVPAHEWEESFFHLCANADPGRDLIRHDHRVGFDATTKVPGDERNGEPVRRYPPIVSMDPDVADRVAERWDELFGA